MMSTSSVYPRSAPGYGYIPYGHQDMGQLNNWFIDDSLFSYDLQLLQAELDPLPLCTTIPQISEPIFCHSEVSFSSSLCQSWPDELFPGQFIIPEMQGTPTTGLDIPGSTTAARSCSPVSDSSLFSDAASFSSIEPSPVLAIQTPGAGPSTAATSPAVGSMSTLALPSSVGPIRRGRGRPRKDAPFVHQPPPLCTYFDPLTATPCNKLLNRLHDLPRHTFKHAQEEAALVNSGRLPRELATLLPDDWKEKDELKLPCRFCSQTFSRADAVKRHEKNEHKHRPRKTRG